jgi:hypothetical protein
MSINFAAAVAGGPQVNLANGNAAQVFHLLGLEFDGDFGEAPGQDFLGRVLLAQALLDASADQGEIPAHQVGRVVEWGRRAGYLADKLADLRTVANWAVRQHAEVVWY